MIPSQIAGYPIILPEHRHRFHTEHPEWHKAWLDSIHESLKPDDIVCDVGSEQGDLSALVASWIPDGDMWLVEPVAKFWPTIKVTFEANDLGPPKGSMVAFASDESSDPPPIGYWERWPVESEQRITDEPGFQHLNERPDLPTFTLNLILSRDRPSALLIDAEGAELKILRGAERVLIQDRPLVWCAIHPEIMRDRYGHDPNELLAFMHRMGYRWDFLGFQGELHFKFSPR